jgi:hypothetical protein
MPIFNRLQVEKLPLSLKRKERAMRSFFPKFIKKDGRVHHYLLTAAGVLFLTAVILASAGCYETDFEIISASSAVSVYGLPGTYTKEKGGTMIISAVPLSNDYRFREISKDNKTSTGYLRAVPLQGNIYIVQAKYDDDPVYYLGFYQFRYDSSGAHYKPMEPTVSEKSLDQLAKQYGVIIDWDTLDFVPDLKGSPGNIMAFLRAHANLAFAPAK